MEILGDAPDNPPREAYEPVLADLDESLRTFRTEPAFSLRAMARFQHGDVAPTLLPLLNAGQLDDVVDRLGPLVEAQPDNYDLLFLRAAFRLLTGNASGARRDREQAAQMASRAPG
jgi:hypothetical protein